MAQKKDGRLAAQQNKAGLSFYKTWEIDKAIAAFQSAAAADPSHPDYPLNLARTYARSGDFGLALEALGDYLHNEPDEAIAARYEWLFASTLDDVEKMLTDAMTKMELSLPQVGKALQMWLEYRIMAGRRPLRIRKPEVWAAAITYAIVKTNFLPIELVVIAAAYGVKSAAVQTKYKELVEALDLIAADYRYFVGDENPLDKVVDAGETAEARDLLTELERRFKNNKKSSN